MKKSDLIAGEHVVELKQVAKFLYTGKAFVNDLGEWASLNSYNDDLTCNVTRWCDIVRILKVAKPGKLSTMIKDAEEVWTRKDTTEYDKLMKKIEELQEQAEKLKP